MPKRSHSFSLNSERLQIIWNILSADFADYTDLIEKGKPPPVAGRLAAFDICGNNM
jgi:hypothetical protein